MNRILDRKSIRRFSVVLAVGVLSLCGRSLLRAADPTFVGVLALAVDEEGAKKLQLSPEVREKLLSIIDQREAAALELVAELKTLPEDQRQARLAPFVAESEKQGMVLLSEEQRQKLEQIRVARAGMASLAEAAMAEKLSLTDAQKAKVDEVLKTLDQRLTQGGEDQRRLYRVVAERDLAKVLSPQQRAQWDQLAGLASETPPPVAVAAADQAVTDPAAAPQPPQPAASPTNPPPPATVAEGQPAPPKEKLTPVDERKLRFNFRFQPWKDVLEWFAEQADLSMTVVEDPPPGTFNYTDDRFYSPAEAIDLLNSVLLTKGYTLVRRDRLLMLINLEGQSIPPDLVSRVSVEDLEKRGEFELVSVLFQLNKFTPEDAENEIRKLLGPQGDVRLLATANQVLVTETAGKLRTIAKMIEAVENPEKSKQEALKMLSLQYVTADELMMTARSLLNIPEEQNATEDGSLRIAFEPLGMRVFVTGRTYMVKQLEDIIKLVDVPLQTRGGAEGPGEAPQLEVYTVTDADSASVLAVMQTLLAGQPGVNLATDPLSGNLIALAFPSQHKTIKATLDQMQRDASQVEVIQLTRLDPQVVLLAINSLFGLGSTEEGANKNAPRVEVEPNSMQLLIRASAHEIEQIKSLLTKMGEGGASGELASQSNVRTLPFTGRASQNVMEQMELIWPTVRPNRLRVVTPSAISPSLRGLRRMGPRLEPEGDGDGQQTPKQAEPSLKTTRQAPSGLRRTTLARQTLFVSHPQAPASAEEQESKSQPPTNAKDLPEIIVAPGPGGIIIASQDIEALNEFEALLRTLMEKANAAPPEPTIFYLRYAKCDVAKALLDQILGGGTADSGGGGGDLISGIANQALGDVGGGLLGGLLGLGGGGAGALTTTGSYSIVPDPRLNALIVQANTEDLNLIEQLLEVVDQQFSPQKVQTITAPRLIPVVYTSAEEVAGIVQAVYADRIQGQQQAGGNRQPSPEDLIRALRGNRGGGANRQQEDDTQKMRLGVDKRSNALIVSAPDPLFEEVRLLVEQLDHAGIDSDETLSVVRIGGATNPEVVSKALASLLKGSGAAASSPTSSTSGSSQAAPNADQIRQRIDFFRGLQGLQGGGGRGGAPTGAPGGGRTFGGRGGGSPFGGGAPTGGGRGGGGRGGRG